MQPLVFRPSLGFIFLGAVSPLVLIVLGAWGMLQAGEVRAFPLVLAILGGLLALVAAFDVPYRITVNKYGVERRCLLRQQLFGWDDIVAFRRPQPRRGRRGVGQAGTGPTSATVDDSGSQNGKGGLLLETKARRQYLLSYSRERPETYGAIQEAVRRYAPGMSLPGPPYYPRADSSL